MSSRIRYSLTSDPNVLVSVKTFQHPSSGSRYKVVLNTADHQWSVIDDTCGLIAASGHVLTLNLMKKHAKNTLIGLGITFTSEKGTKKSRTKQA